MIKIGITGTIASGKTSFSILLKRRGFSVFNADQYAKMATHAGNPCFDALIEVLGEDVKDSSGDIDRKKMADCIFHDEDKRKAVNAIVHPYVQVGMEKFFTSHNKDAFVFAEVPLLFEAGLQDAFDEIICITCQKDVAIRRMMEDREYSEEEANARYQSQMHSYQDKASIVIENDTDLKALDAKVNQLVGTLRRKTRHVKK